MHIAIPWFCDFPEGFALNNRFIAFAKGLRAHGASVVVLCLSPISRDAAPPDFNGRGIHEGIEYIFTAGGTTASQYRLYRPFQRLQSFVKGLCELWRRRNAQQLDVLFFPGMRAWHMLLILLLAKLRGIKTVNERNEHPYLESEGSLLRKLECFFCFRLLSRFCDGIEVISTPLETLYRTKLGTNIKMLVVPAIVDFSRFEQKNISGPAPVAGHYIAWCGSVWGQKDGVPHLVEAFLQIAGKHPVTSLVLIAPKDASPDYRQIEKRILGSGCADRIVMTGKVSQAEMPAYLGNAAVLALARPSSIQSEFGFPTKLPEYLATGRPVLVTRVGDIPKYLIDGESAYLVDPDDIEGFSRKMDYILKHPDEAREVGHRGKLLALREFSGNFQSGRLSSFFGELA